MQLHTLLRDFVPAIDLSKFPNVPITGVQEDSRLVVAGNLFVARSGTRNDGARFALDALARGAAVIVAEKALPSCPAPVILVPDAGRAVSILANIFYQRPSANVKVLGVTGTKGKTTVTYLIRHLLARVNKKCGVVGTVEIDDGRTVRQASMTTPSAVEIASVLAAMRDSGCRGCAIEVSSHALDQWRVSGVHFVAAGFTNLGRDHFNYHGDWEPYAAAKARLFELLDKQGTAVINGADKWSSRMIRDCRGRCKRFGFGQGDDYRATDARITTSGSTFLMTAPDGSAPVTMGLIGQHNIENALLAAALVAESFGLSVHQLAEGLRDAPITPGRLQAVDCGQPFAVYVDYAHTDNSLQSVLTALGGLPHRKLRVLFGCGGNRDAGKRPIMAKMAQEHADFVYVTSDNPRDEDPRAIIEHILAGFAPGMGSRLFVDPDRRAAIARILRDACPGDIVLLAGKGHEDYQIVGSEKRHFDDVEEAGAVLKELRVKS